MNRWPRWIPPTARKVLGDLRTIQRDLGITCVVNMHHLDLARDYADRIIGMRDGKVVFDGPTAEATDSVIAEVYQREVSAGDQLAPEAEVSSKEPG